MDSLCAQVAHCTHFNVVLYDAGVHVWRPDGVAPVTARNLRRAWAWVDAWQPPAAGAGGRNLLGAVRAACDALRPQAHGTHGVYVVAGGPGEQAGGALAAFTGELVAGSATRVHATAYCCHANAVAARQLRSLAAVGGGRYHVVHEEGSPLDAVHVPGVSWAVQPPPPPAVEAGAPPGLQAGASAARQAWASLPAKVQAAGLQAANSPGTAKDARGMGESGEADTYEVLAMWMEDHTRGELRAALAATGAAPVVCLCLGDDLQALRDELATGQGCVACGVRWMIPLKS